MSLSNAANYARRARNSGTIEEVGDNANRAIEQLIREIKQLQSRVAYLESKVR